MMDDENKRFGIDLNCDLGEYDDPHDFELDAAIMNLISSCNIACGAHAGNQSVIEQTVALALKKGVYIGAHPSYPDRENFGRLPMKLPANELKPIMDEQILAIKLAAENQGGKLSHVKPHGALYNQAAVDLDLALVLMDSVAAIDSNLMFYGLAHSKMQQAAEQVGLFFVAEGFADRAYTATKMLVPRTVTGAVISDLKLMLKRVLQMLSSQHVYTIKGELIPLEIDTLCLHGDHENSLETAQFLSQGLLQAGFQIQPPQLQHPDV